MTPFLTAIMLVRTLPCLAERGRIIVIGRPQQPLDAVIPYLASLPGVIAYNPERNALTFRRERGFLSLQSDEVCITQVKDVAEGLELLQALTESINAVWEKRDQLAPQTTGKNAPRPLELWALLPQTNCGQCGEATCLAFAVGLIQHQRRLAECKPLTEPQYHDRRLALERMV